MYGNVKGIVITILGGLYRCIHQDNAEDRSLVIKRAIAACKKDYKGSYHLARFNCEHFVNACWRVGGSHGFSFLPGEHWFPNPSAEETEDLDTIREPVQAYDEDENDDMNIAFIDE